MDNETIKKMIESLCSDECGIAKKSLDYYDGNQLSHVISELDDPYRGRKNWRQRGFIPRSRNIIKTIVDKSGLLFCGNAPHVEVQYDNVTDDALSTNLLTELNKAGWVEFFTNFDNMVRLLRTGAVLIQYVPETQSMTLDPLHKGNAYLAINPVTKNIETALVNMGCEVGSDDDLYRLFTIDKISDYAYDDSIAGGRLTLMAEYDNTYGCIPVAVFHDTHTPRYGLWNQVPTDLLGLNDAYNFHLIDLEYAAKFSNRKALFTNVDIKADFTPASTVGQVNLESGSYTPQMNTTIMAPDRIIRFDTGPGDNPFVEFKGPDINPQPTIDMMRAWIKDFAHDWCVDVNFDGSGGATSGFQLVVEQIDNLELRKQRQRMMEAGFKRLYKVIASVLTSVGKPFDANADLFVQFDDPELPVDNKVEEEMWSLRIKESRASRVDYFMATQGMTKEEAEEKVAEIDGYNDARIAKAQQLGATSTTKSGATKMVISANASDMLNA